MAVNNQNNRLDLAVIRLLSEKCERKANVLSLEANLFYAAGLPHRRFDLYAAEICKDLAGYLHAHGKKWGNCFWVYVSFLRDIQSNRTSPEVSMIWIYGDYQTKSMHFA